MEPVPQLLNDTPQACHPGRDSTLAAARSKYYWPTMRLDQKNMSLSASDIDRLKVLPKLFQSLNTYHL